MAFSFGTNTATPGSTFGGFGSTAKTSGSSLFGSGFGTTTTSTGFGGFGAKPTGTATAFNFGGSAATATTTKSLFGGFGSTTTTTAAGTSLFSGFGAKTTAPTGFSGFGSTTTGFGGFGATTSAATGFGSGLGTGLFTGFGAKSTATGFGTTATQPTWSIGQQPQQQQQAIPDNPLTIMTSVLTMPTLFGDERDSVLAKLNQLQALWGVGKAYYAPNAQPITFLPENPFCRFMAIGYSCLPSAKDSDGFVAIDLKHKESYVKENQQQFVEAIQKILGSKPTLSICVDGVRSLPGDKCEVIIYLVERQANGTSRRILATELYAFLSQANCQNQMTQLGVENMVAKTALSESQLKQFLDTPPIGVDTILWEQAKKDNPDPKNLIPVPMMGYNELLTRLKHQQDQSTQHKRRLHLVSEEIKKLQISHSTTIAKIAQYKRKHLELGHRVLEVMINQECYRKTGYAIEPEEEQLRIQLESIQSELNTPMQYKGRLNELMSQIRLQSQINPAYNNSSFIMDDTTKLEIKQHLMQQHCGLMELISIIKDDVDDLKIVENSLLESIYQPRR